MFFALSKKNIYAQSMLLGIYFFRNNISNDFLFKRIPRQVQIELARGGKILSNNIAVDPNIIC